MKKRSNQDWIEELSGQKGPQAQRQAHEDLANYLYKVSFNNLKIRRDAGTPKILSGYVDKELAQLAPDFVQELLERMARNQFKLLQTFRGEGDFKSWLAVILNRNIKRELKKAYWRRLRLQPEKGGTDLDSDELPRHQFQSQQPATEDKAILSEVMTILEACIEGLSPRRRLAVQRIIIEEEDVASTAEMLQTTVNAVYLLIFNARRQLTVCLRENGVDEGILAIF